VTDRRVTEATEATAHLGPTSGVRTASVESRAPPEHAVSPVFERGKLKKLIMTVTVSTQSFPATFDTKLLEGTRA
jgi:hypothetical protein